MSSYTQTLKSSSLIGGAQGINLLLGMVRVKFAAVLIGPVGVGLLGNYMAIQGLVGTMAEALMARFPRRFPQHKDALTYSADLAERYRRS